MDTSKFPSNTTLIIFLAFTNLASYWNKNWTLDQALNGLNSNTTTVTTIWKEYLNLLENSNYL